MMTLPLVTQLHFARSEFVRSMAGLTDDDARHRFEPMNCISWMIGHLAAQENFYWVRMAQGKKLHADLWKLVATGQPASTPPLDDMWTAWRDITAAADLYLDSLSAELLSQHLTWGDKAWRENIGTCLQRNIYHYWFHNGEAQAVRQMLGHSDLPQFVGDMSAAVYVPE
ncbi:MAG: DinB family protein [Anaerolineae bacterium]|nr:DinB family protein [Anaerolineae bacterium]MCO5194935.1 DinB family protein [Anaerolineae bacterium]MCO5197049.1 DinB family protein [Anaerolineae bacterium]